MESIQSTNNTVTGTFNTQAQQMNAQDQSELENLPLEIIREISMYLAPRDILAAARTSKEMQKKFDNDAVWSQLTAKREIRVPETGTFAANKSEYADIVNDARSYSKKIKIHIIYKKDENNKSKESKFLLQEFWLPCTRRTTVQAVLKLISDHSSLSLKKMAGATELFAYYELLDPKETVIQEYSIKKTNQIEPNFFVLGDSRYAKILNALVTDSKMSDSSDSDVE